MIKWAASLLAIFKKNKINTDGIAVDKTEAVTGLTLRKSKALQIAAS